MRFIEKQRRLSIKITGISKFTGAKRNIYSGTANKTRISTKPTSKQNSSNRARFL
jgi:hypothetical protein